jgi:hypothetical protein
VFRRHTSRTMEIRITKKDRRNELACLRSDGTRTAANLGPALPYHDLAHYVVERHFRLREGFFGNVAAGYSMEALADKAVIQSLGAQSWVAEVLARALGSLFTGACTLEQFPLLVTEELAAMRMSSPAGLSAALGDELLGEFRSLVARYDALKNGETLKLQFE